MQTTSLAHVSDRLAKAQGRPGARTWLAAGGRFEVHGWRGSEVKQVEVRAEDLASVVVQTPKRRGGKGSRQRELFA